VIKPGEEWGEPTTEAPAFEIDGDDAALAATVPPVAASAPPLVRFAPVGSDLARAVGLAASHASVGIAVPVDALDTDHGVAVNALVLGVAPASLRAWHRSRHVTVIVDGRTVHDGPASTVVVANGQYVDGADLAPRGHPGDGRAEIQVYRLRPGERAAMRRRLPTGTHLPHPRIVTASGRAVTVAVRTGVMPLRLDGHGTGAVRAVTATVRHPALRLLL
jgi:diacylglycerol kinase family enzyme